MPNFASRNHSGHSYCRNDRQSVQKGPAAILSEKTVFRRSTASPLGVGAAGVSMPYFAAKYRQTCFNSASGRTRSKRMASAISQCDVLIIAAEPIELDLPRLDLGGVAAGLGPLLHQFRIVFPEAGQGTCAAGDGARVQVPGRIPRTFSVDAPKSVIGPGIGKPDLVVSLHVSEGPIPGVAGEDPLAVVRGSVGPSCQQEKRMRSQVAGIEVIRAVHVSLRVEADDRLIVRAFGHSRGLAGDLVDIVSLSRLVEPLGHLAAIVGHNAGIRFDPPDTARQVLGDESRIGGLGPSGEGQCQIAGSNEEFSQINLSRCYVPVGASIGRTCRSWGGRGAFQ